MADRNIHPARRKDDAGRWDATCVIGQIKDAEKPQLRSDAKPDAS